MAHRTCGVTYYATALPPFLSEKTEITLVRKELEQSFEDMLLPSLEFGDQGADNSEFGFPAST